jgi:hypothetical protein
MKNTRLKAALLLLGLVAVLTLGSIGRVGLASADLGPLGFTPTEAKVTEVTKEPPVITEPPPAPTAAPYKTPRPTRAIVTQDPPPGGSATPVPNQQPAATASAVSPGGPLPPAIPPLQFNGCSAGARYAIKFVCGYRQATSNGEPPVKPGNYATAINIHNFNDANACGMARPALSYRPGDTPAAAINWQSLSLARVSDLELDCNYLWKVTGTKPGSFLMGMLDLGLGQNLPVAVVYTASITDKMDITGSGAGISIDVEYVQPFWP